MNEFAIVVVLLFRLLGGREGDRERCPFQKMNILIDECGHAGIHPIPLKGKPLGSHMLASKQSNLPFEAPSKLVHYCMID